MKIAIQVILFLFLGSSAAYSQEPIGYFFDINCRPIHGYYDVLNYTPKEQIAIVHTADSFEKGYYYGTDGKKHEGLILLGKHGKIQFKKTSAGSKQNIDFENIRSIKLGLDSFFTISNSIVVEKILGHSILQDVS